MEERMDDECRQLCRAYCSMLGMDGREDGMEGPKLFMWVGEAGWTALEALTEKERAEACGDLERVVRYCNEADPGSDVTATEGGVLLLCWAVKHGIPLSGSDWGAWSDEDPYLLGRSLERQALCGYLVRGGRLPGTEDSRADGVAADEYLCRLALCEECPGHDAVRTWDHLVGVHWTVEDADIARLLFVAYSLSAVVEQLFPRGGKQAELSGLVWKLFGEPDFESPGRARALLALSLA
ncbi:uncharacterized protein B0I36DRAFT_339542 [Microdochium trichocladiopsis]|uniref:Uncharacterized protein n=1 Tax=Microdochium trichocladiopsis TaxID=1682393 RepID=A0A9P8XSL0_9PEZI|nr:uncharacterized protein B0I36DRAFT_339542 [Microdochium trichocladiopsis]KAH7012523.1 hypothetical protein B0I36DRAFT_339542 [Microdochium trichocladiopsis]